MEIKRQQMGVMSLIIFSVLVLVGIVIFNSISISTSNINLGTTTAATASIGNVTGNTWGAMNLISVGPIIFGAVIILGIVGMLYLKR